MRVRSLLRMLVCIGGRGGLFVRRPKATACVIHMENNLPGTYEEPKPRLFFLLLLPLLDFFLYLAYYRMADICSGQSEYVGMYG